MALRTTFAAVADPFQKVFLILLCFLLRVSFVILKKKKEEYLYIKNVYRLIQHFKELKESYVKNHRAKSISARTPFTEQIE